MGNLIVCEAQVERFVEIDQGVWFPIRMISKGYDETAFYRDHKYQLNDTYIAEVSNVSLNPKISLEFFSEHPIPDGARVYKVKHGHIIEKYTKGMTKPIPVKIRREKNHRISMYMIFIGFAGLFIVIGGIVRFARRKRPALS